MASFNATRKMTPKQICSGALNLSPATQRDSDRGSRSLSPWPCTVRMCQEGPLTQHPWLQPGKLVFKWFSWRHKGLVTSLMPPFNAELFRIPPWLHCYSGWHGTFTSPLGELENVPGAFVLSSFSVSIYFSSKAPGWCWQLCRQRAMLSRNQ